MTAGQMLKALTAAAITGLSSVSVAYTDGHLTAAEIITAAIATLSALALVWAVPNTTTPEKESPHAVQS